MSVTGTWKLTMKSPLGEQPATLLIEEAGGVPQGTLTGQKDPSPLKDLAVAGDNVTFSAEADTPVGKLTLGFTCVVTGDSIAGKYSTPFGAFDVSGTRA
jgi:hypothetical protein